VGGEYEIILIIHGFAEAHAHATDGLALRFRVPELLDKGPGHPGMKRDIYDPRTQVSGPPQYLEGRLNPVCHQGAELSSMQDPEPVFSCKEKFPAILIV